jgi:hypothetical protein
MHIVDLVDLSFPTIRGNEFLNSEIYCNINPNNDIIRNLPSVKQKLCSFWTFYHA